MLERNRQPEAAAPLAPETRLIDLDRLLGIFLRQWRVLAICTAIGILLGLIYLTLAPRSYYAGGEILIDQSTQQLVSDVTERISSSTLEAEVLNQIEVLRSSSIARAVVEDMGLNTDPEFLNPAPSFTARVITILTGLFGRPAPEPVTEVPVDIATRWLMSGVIVERQGRSSVIGVGYIGSSPALAYRVASSYMQQFLRQQLNSDVTTQATAWLQQQLIQLGESRRQASDAVEQFRLESGQSVEQDQALTDQRIEALTSQLVVAQSETARVRALSQQAQSAIDQGPGAAGANASLLLGGSTTDPATTALLAQYANTSRRIEEVTASFGADHPQLAVLQRDLTALSNQIYDKLLQLRGRYTSDLRIAQGRETALRQTVQDEGLQSAETNQSQIELNELEQKASALEVLYNSFLTRYEESVRLQSFQITSARIISEPVPSNAAVSPRTLFTMAGATLFGLFLGACFGAINELRERSIRLASQVSTELGLRFAGYLPELKLRRPRGKMVATLPEEEMHELIRQQLLNARSGGLATAFVESLKSSRVLLHERRHTGGAVVVGVSSVLPGEGKTTYAVALAEMLAANGARVLLIDADLRHPVSSRLTAPYAGAGLIEALSGESWRALIHTDAQTQLSILPAVSALERTIIGDPLLSDGMAKLIEEVRAAFEFVIVDMPPLGPIVDARSVLPLTDGLMLVVEWGRTAKRLVRSTLENDPQLERSIIGVVLNRVDFDKLPRYSQLGESERYIGAYESYYRPIPVAKA